MKQLNEYVGFPCDNRIPPHVNAKIHKRIVQPAMLYMMVQCLWLKLPNEETGRDRDEYVQIGQTLRDHERNGNIRERLNQENITERCRKTRSRWFGQVKRRDQEIVGR